MSRLAVGAAALLVLPLGANWAGGQEKGEKAEKGQTAQKVVVLQDGTLAVKGEGVLVLTVPGTDEKSPAASDKTKTEKVEGKAITVITKGDSQEKTSQLHLPLNVLNPHKVTMALTKQDTRKFKGTGRPKSVTIAYEDGAKETIELGDCDLLTLDVAAGTVSLAQRPKVVAAVTKGGLAEKRLVDVLVHHVPGTTKPHAITKTAVTEHKADAKKDAGVEARLERMEQVLQKLQQEIKSLKKE